MKKKVSEKIDSHHFHLGQHESMNECGKIVWHGLFCRPSSMHRWWCSIICLVVARRERDGYLYNPELLFLNDSKTI